MEFSAILLKQRPGRIWTKLSKLNTCSRTGQSVSVKNGNKNNNNNKYHEPFYRRI